MKWKPLFITACGAAVAVGSLAAWAQVPEETKPTAEVPPVAETAEQADKPAATKPAVAEASIEEGTEEKKTEEKKAEQPTAEAKSATTTSAATPKSSGTATVPSASSNFSVPQPAKGTGTAPPSSSGYGSSTTTIPGASVRYGVSGNNFSVPQPGTEPQQSFIPGMATISPVRLSFSNIEVKDSEITKSLQACSETNVINADTGRIEVFTLYDLDDEALAQLGRVIQKSIESDPQPPKKRIEEMRTNNSSAKHLNLHFSNRGYEEYGKLLSAVIERLRKQSQERQGNRVEELLGIAAGEAMTPSLVNGDQDNKVLSPADSFTTDSPDAVGPGAGDTPATEKPKDAAKGNPRFSPFASDEAFELKPIEANVKAIAEALERFTRVELVVDGKIGQNIPTTDFSAAERQQLGEMIMRAIEKDPQHPAPSVEVRSSEKTNALQIHFSREGYEQYGKYLPDLIARLQFKVNMRKQELANKRMGELMGQPFVPEMFQPAPSNTGELEMGAAVPADRLAEVERRPVFERKHNPFDGLNSGAGGNFPDPRFKNGNGYDRGNSGQNINVDEMTIAGMLAGKQHLVIVSPQKQWASSRLEDLDDQGRQQLARIIVKAIQDDKLADVDRVVAYPASENNEGSLDLFVSDKVYEEYRTLLPKVVSKLHQDFVNRTKAAEGKKLYELLKAAEGGQGGRSQSIPSVSSSNKALNGEKPNNQTLPGQPTYQPPSGYSIPPALSSGRALPAPGNASWQPTYQPPTALFDPDPKYQQLEQQAAELARRVKQAAGKPEEEDRLADELRAVVTQAFEHRMEKQRQQLDQAEAKLKASREHLQKRQQHAEQIITRRVEDLTGSNPFPWNEAPQPVPTYAPTFSPPYDNSGYNNGNNYVPRGGGRADFPAAVNHSWGTQGQPPQVYPPPTSASSQPTSQPRFQDQTAPAGPWQAPESVPEKKPGPSPKRTNAPANPPAASSHKKKPAPGQGDVPQPVLMY